MVVLFPRSEITVIRLNGAEFDGAKSGSFAVFKEFDSPTQFPSLSLVSHNGQASIEFASPDPLGVRIGQEQNCVLGGACILGVLFAIAETEYSLREVLSVKLAA